MKSLFCRVKEVFRKLRKTTVEIFTSHRQHFLCVFGGKVMHVCEIFVPFSLATDVMTVTLTVEDLENTASSMKERGMSFVNYN